MCSVPGQDAGIAAEEASDVSSTKTVTYHPQPLDAGFAFDLVQDKLDGGIDIFGRMSSKPSVEVVICRSVHGYRIHTEEIGHHRVVPVSSVRIV